MEKQKKGGVKEAKRMLEDRIRKEKREQKLAEVRKPLITTPLRKRTRQEGGEWPTDEDDQEASAMRSGVRNVKNCHRHQLGPSW